MSDEEPATFRELIESLSDRCTLTFKSVYRDDLHAWRCEVSAWRSYDIKQPTIIAVGDSKACRLESMFQALRQVVEQSHGIFERN